MSDLIQIIIAGIIVLAIVIPLAIVFDKWKKEMNEDENRNG